MARDVEQGWKAASLNKAYRQGYLSAVMGLPRERCPYRGQVAVAAWESGWEDGVAGLEAGASAIAGDQGA
ncbi:MULTISPECIES: ribosome modulation factor [Marinobacter]|uniref:ribosome modulation factor n=1 Tax=Marinobacter TaxID=2742 RepID=UPI000DAEE144|nr:MULTISPECIES: ribosome modulation factor [Marinobacter]